MIPYGKQDITREDVEAVVEALQSDWLTQGPRIGKFETAVADKLGAAHVCAVSSATAALHVAALALELGPGDWLWTTPNTFVASANCGLYCGAKVDFVDIDPDTYNICTIQLAERLSQAERKGRLPKVLVPVHHSGQSCEMQKIAELARAYGVKVIEDASHAIGGRYQQDYVGSCRFSDVTVFSLHPVKIITSGEGGLALTNDLEVAARMSRLRSHGVTRDTALLSRGHDEPWYYEQLELGFNYRITDIQVALAHSQLARLDAYVEQRNVLAERYDELLAKLPVRTPKQLEDVYSARHLYVIQLEKDTDGCYREEVFVNLRSAGIGANVHYIPVHMQPYYQQLGFRRGAFPVAERYYERAISLPLFPTMTLAQQDQVVEALSVALASAG